MAKTDLDWEAIEGDYRAGQMSIRAIARAHGCSDGTIRGRAKRDNWARDLSDQVRHAVRSASLRTPPRVKHDGSEDLTAAEIIEQAAQRGAALIDLHRSDIEKLRKREQEIIEELGPGSVKEWAAQYQGDVIKDSLKLSASEKAAAINALASTMTKRILLERQAYNLDEQDRYADKMLIELD